jgi:integrase
MSEICVLEKVGKVSIEKCRNSIRLRFREDGRTVSRTIGELNAKNMMLAREIAQEIQGTSIPLDTTIKDIASYYLEIKKDYIPYNTRRVHISTFLNWIESIPDSLQSIQYHKIHFDTLKKMYGIWTQKNIWTTFKAACNLCVESGLLPENPYTLYNRQFPTPMSKRSRQPFEVYEVARILKSFKDDEFSDSKAYPDSYYYPFVLFLSLTGCRPQEAIALEKKDIFVRGTSRYIIFNKAFNGKSVSSTKTNKPRKFPINNELMECIALAQTTNYHSNLLFPSPRSQYLVLSLFTSRKFNKIVKKLYEQKEIENKLPTYHLRHFFITEMVRKNIDVGTIANLVGNTPEVIFKNYLGNNVDIILPDLL